MNNKKHSTLKLENSIRDRQLPEYIHQAISENNLENMIAEFETLFENDSDKIFQELNSYEDSHGFCYLNRVFEHLLLNPKISFTTEQVLDFLHKGESLAYRGAETLERFLDQKINKISEAINLIKVNPEKYYLLIPTILKSYFTVDVNKTIDFIKEHINTSAENVRNAMLFSISLFKLNTLSSAQEALQLSSGLALNNNSRISLEYLVRSFYEISKYDNSLEEECFKQINLILDKENSTEAYLFLVNEIRCHSLFNKIKNWDKVIDYLLSQQDVFLQCNPSRLDFFFKEFFQHDFDSALDVFLKFSLGFSSGALINLEHTIRSLVDLKDKRTEDFITYSFLYGSYALCKDISRIIADNLEAKDIKISDKFLNSDLRNNPITFQILASRLAGFLYFKPKLLFFYLIQILEEVNADDESRGLIEHLIDDFIVLSYQGKTQEFLKEAYTIYADSEEIKSVLDQINQKLESYKKHIFKAGSMKELETSYEHRRIYSNYTQERWQDTMKEAKKQSPLLSSVKERAILFGTKTVTWRNKTASDNNFSSRNESPMNLFEYSGIVPFLEVINPVFYYNSLRILRNIPPL